MNRKLKLVLILVVIAALAFAFAIPALAVDGDANINSVDLYDGTNLIDEDATSSYVASGNALELRIYISGADTVTVDDGGGAVSASENTTGGYYSHPITGITTDTTYTIKASDSDPEDSTEDTWQVVLKPCSTDYSIDNNTVIKGDDSDSNILPYTYYPGTHTFVLDNPIPNDLDGKYSTIDVYMNCIDTEADVVGSPINVSAMLDGDHMDATVTVLSEVANEYSAGHHYYDTYSRAYTVSIDKAVTDPSITAVNVYDGVAVDATKQIATLNNPATETVNVPAGNQITLEVTTADATEVSDGTTTATVASDTSTFTYTVGDTDTTVNLTATNTGDEEDTCAITLDPKATTCDMSTLAINGYYMGAATLLTPVFDAETDTYTITIPNNAHNPYRTVGVTGVNTLDYGTNFGAQVPPGGPNVPSRVLVDTIVDGGTMNAEFSAVPEIAVGLQTTDYLYEAYVAPYTLTINKIDTDPTIAYVDVYMGSDTTGTLLDTIVADGDTVIVPNGDITLRVYTSDADEVTIDTAEPAAPTTGYNDYTLTVAGDQAIAINAAGSEGTVDDDWTINLAGKNTGCEVVNMGLQSKVYTALPESLTAIASTEYDNFYTARIPNDENIPKTKVLFGPDFAISAGAVVSAYSPNFITGQPGSPYLDASILLNNSSIYSTFEISSEYSDAVGPTGLLYDDYIASYTLIVKKDAVLMTMDKVQIYAGSTADPTKLIAELTTVDGDEVAVPNGPVTVRVYATYAAYIDIDGTTAPFGVGGYADYTFDVDGTTVADFAVNATAESTPALLEYELTLEGTDTSTNANLAAMNLNVSRNSGTEYTQAYTPAFDKDTTEYDVLIPYAYNTLNTLHFYLTAEDAAAQSIVVDGTNSTPVTVDPLTHLAEIALNTAGDTVTVTVTSESGATKVYTLNVTYTADATLKTMTAKVSRGELGAQTPATVSPLFSRAADKYTYDVIVPYKATPYNYLHLTLAAYDSSAKAIEVVSDVADGYDLITGSSGTASVAIDTDGDVVYVTVIGADDSEKTYMLDVEYEGDEVSDDATLDDAVFTYGSSDKEVKLSPTFKSSKTSYTGSVSSSTDEVNFEFDPADANAEVKVYLNGDLEDTFTGADDIDLDLKKGKNTIKAKVTASDDDATKTYTFTITRGEATSDYLSGLSIKDSSGSTISYSPSFSSSTTSYSATVANSVTRVALKALLVDDESTLKIDGSTVDDNTWSSYINLSVGTNIIYVKVTDEDNSTRTYQVTITRNSDIVTTSKTLKLWLNSSTAYVDSAMVILDAAPFLYKYAGVNYTVVPIRFVGEQGLGATVNWDSATKTVSIVKNGTYVYMTLGVANPSAGLVCPPVAKDNRIFVPLRYVAESFGCTVNYTGINDPIVIVTP
jgi:hypothetical protein